MSRMSKRLSFSAKRFSLSTKALGSALLGLRSNEEDEPSPSGLCVYRGVSVAFLREFALRIESGELALNINLFTLRDDYNVPGKGGLVLAKGTTVMRKRKLASDQYAVLAPRIGEVVVDSGAVQFKERTDWDMDDVLEYVVKRNATLRRDDLTFVAVIEKKHPDAVGRAFQGTYLSQPRSTRFCDLVSSLEHHYAGRNLKKTFVWFDIFGCNQNRIVPDGQRRETRSQRKNGNSSTGAQSESPERVLDQLTLLERTEALRQRDQLIRNELPIAVKRFSEFILFLPSIKDLGVLRRAWCLWEVYCAAIGQVRVVIVQGEANSSDADRQPQRLVSDFDKLLEAFSGVDLVEGSQCCLVADRELVTKAVEAHGGAELVNPVVRRALRSWLGGTMDRAASEVRRTAKRGNNDTLLLLASLYEAQVVLLRADQRPADALDKYRELRALVQKFRADKLAGMQRALKRIATICTDGEPARIEELLSMRASEHRKLQEKLQQRPRERDVVAATRQAATVGPSPRHSAGSGEASLASFASNGSSTSSSSLPSRSSNTSGGSGGSGGRLFGRPAQSHRAEATGPDEAHAPVRHADGSMEVVAGLLQTGLDLKRVGRPAEALERFQEADRMVRRVEALSDDLDGGFEDLGDAGTSARACRDLHVKVLKAMAAVLSDKMCFAAARDAIQEALSIQREDLGPRSLAVVETMREAAMLDSRLGEHDRAIELLEEALAALYLLGAKDNVVRVAVVERSLGQAYSRKRDLKSAVRHYDQALDLFREVHGDDHEDVAETLDALAIVLPAEEAIDVAREAVETWRAINGDEDERVADALNNLAVLLDEQKLRAEAIVTYREALAAFVASVGPEHTRVGDVFYNMAAVLLADKRLDEALEHYEQALHIFHVNDHVHAGLALNNIAVVLEMQGRLDEAFFASKEALKVFAEKLGEDHHQTRRLRKKIERITRRRSRRHSRSQRGVSPAAREIEDLEAAAAKGSAAPATSRSYRVLPS